jgi:hypothetical protein
MFELNGAGLAGIIRGLGDRAAKGLYGDQAHKLRGNVWGDIVGGIGESLGGGDVLGPARFRVRQVSPSKAPKAAGFADMPIISPEMEELLRAARIRDFNL